MTPERESEILVSAAHLQRVAARYEQACEDEALLKRTVFDYQNRLDKTTKVRFELEREQRQAEVDLLDAVVPPKDTA